MSIKLFALHFLNGLSLGYQVAGAHRHGESWVGAGMAALVWAVVIYATWGR